jgi:hypothetical protein
VFLYGTKLKFIPCQIASISFKLVSILNYFEALSPTYIQISGKLIRPISITFLKLNSASGFT